MYKEYGYANSESSCAHKYLIPGIISMLNINSPKLILDIGCGNGYVARELLKRDFEVYGVDASEEGINIAKSYYPERFFIQDINKDSLPSELNKFNFDTIISTEVIEHLYDPRTFVRQCKVILEKNGGGQIIISAPYHGYLKNLMLALTNSLDKHFTALWDGGHIKFWSKKTITKLLEEQGFKVINFKGVGRFSYLWKSMIIRAVL